MAFKYILYEKKENIATITLNKPEKLNALGIIGVEEDFKEVLRAFTQAEEDDDIKVVILKGTGRAFCAGEDLSRVGFVYGMGTGKPGERRPSQRIRLKMDRDAEEGFRKIFLCPKLTIAQMHGVAIEGGLYLALHCDFAIAADDTQIGFRGQRLGLAGGAWSVFSILISTIGLKRAVDLYVTGKLISGAEAEKIGLVTKSVPADELEKEVDELAKSLCLQPRDGIAIGKATRHQIYQQIGLTAGFSTGYITHTLFTNLRWEKDEFNFFKVRKNKGTRDAFHERDARYLRKSNRGKSKTGNNS